MKRWLAVVIPPSALLTAIVLYGLVLGVHFAYWKLIFGNWPAASDSVFFQRALLILAWGYGAYRVYRFHPICRPPYRQWLETTPWQAPKPLPHGPVQLLPQDLLIVGSAAALSWALGGPTALYVPHAFLAGYLVALGVTLVFTGPHWAAYVIGIGLDGMVLLWEQVWACLGLGLAVTVAATIGLRQALAAFPWDVTGSPIQGRVNAIHSWDQELGWPFARLGPNVTPLGLGWRDALLIGLLVGWTDYVWARTLLVPELALIAAIGVSGLIAIVRLFIYLDGSSAPISLLGRLLTGRLVIPAYDGVFVGPLLALWIGMGGPIALLTLGVRMEVAGAAALAVSVLLALKVGPSLHQWRLMGGQRHTPPAAVKAAAQTARRRTSSSVGNC